MSLLKTEHVLLTITIVARLDMDNPTVANVLGTAGAVCWSVQVGNSIRQDARSHRPSCFRRSGSTIEDTILKAYNQQ